MTLKPRNLNKDLKDVFGAGWKFEEKPKMVPRVDDFTSVTLTPTPLARDETYITGEERLERLLKKQCLGAAEFFYLKENQHLIPEQCKERDGACNIRVFTFDRDVLVRSDGNRYVLYMYGYDVKWYWASSWLGDEFYARDVSLGLPANTLSSNTLPSSPKTLVLEKLDELTKLINKEFCEQHKGLTEKQEECFDCVFAEGWNKGQENLKKEIFKMIKKNTLRAFD